MSLIGLIIALVVVGVCLWLVNSYIPMDPKIKTLINVIIVVAICIWLLRFAGLA